MDTKFKHFPPKWADRFLEFYCAPTKLEQIQGDAYELFYLNLEERGFAYARFRFWIHVLSFFRWSNIKRTKTYEYPSNPGAMFKSYLKIGWRNLLKQKLTTFISVFGLSLAVACSLVAYLFIEQIWFKGMLQPNKDEIYQLTYTVEEADGKVTYGTVAEPIAELLAQEFSQIKSHTRVRQGFPVLIHKTDSYYQRVIYVDPGFMEMFSFRMEHGYAGALQEPNQVILTYELAEKLFGDASPIGQELSLVIEGKEVQYKVGGVLQKLNDMGMFNFDLLVNFESIGFSSDKLPLQEAWNAELWTFVHLEKGVDPSQLKAGLRGLKENQNQINPDKSYLSLDLLRYTDLVYQIGKIEGGVRDFLGLGPQILLGAISLFILILAVFNYINISILIASRRLKEIGVRKVIGGKRGQLIAQFLSENLLVCLLAVVLGCCLAFFILLPGFNQIANKSLSLDLLHNPYIWTFLIGLVVFITLVSGLYPALFISSFEPIRILKGNQKIGSKSMLTSFLLTFQFVLAIIGIVAGVAFVQTNRINGNRDWGYDKTDKIIVNVPNQEEYFTLKDRLLSMASVEEISGSHGYVGSFPAEREVSFQDQKYKVDYLEAEANYSSILDMKLKLGRLPDPDKISDQREAILVNNEFMEDLGLIWPVDASFSIDSLEYRIIGVVEDFHSVYFQRPIVPTIIRASGDSTFNYLTLKMSPGTAVSAMDLVKKNWRESFPREIFEGQLQADVFDREQQDTKGVQKILLFAAVLAVLLSAMGLYGLVSLNMSSRLKDFSLRRVFGASQEQLSFGLLRRYLIIWMIASVIGGALSYFVISLFLDSFFAFHSGVGALSLGVSLLLLLLVIFLTVGGQIWKVLNTNPAKVLKAE